MPLPRPLKFNHLGQGRLDHNSVKRRYGDETIAHHAHVSHQPSGVYWRPGASIVRAFKNIHGSRAFGENTLVWLINCTLITLDSRSEVTRFQVSPTSLLRKIPSRAASQMFPLVSTDTELMMKSGSSGLGVSQRSPAFTETAITFRFATTTMRSATARVLT